jgi:hypothetical protein
MDFLELLRNEDVGNRTHLTLRSRGIALKTRGTGRTDGRFFGSEGSMVYGCSPLLMGDSFDVVLPKVHGHNESILETSFQFGCQVLHEIIEKNCLTGGAK